MIKGKIRRLSSLDDELTQMQEYFISEAENKTDMYIEKYKKKPSSLNGRYISSDLFKNTFDVYSKSISNVKKYAEAIHNTAAVLANEMFNITVQNPNIKKCVFVTGIPGGGKSFLVQSLALNNLISDDTMVYEGSIVTDTIFRKIDSALENNKQIYIIVVNPTLRLAQTNAINRHFEIGRGASSKTMAKIMSEIPDYLKKINDKYPNVKLGIYNKKTNYDIDYYIGFEHLYLLNHQSYQEIYDELVLLREEILNKKSIND